MSALYPFEETADAIRSEMKKRGFTLGGGYGEWKASRSASDTWATSIVDSRAYAMLDVLEKVASHDDACACSSPTRSPIPASTSFAPREDVELDYRPGLKGEDLLAAVARIRRAHHAQRHRGHARSS